MTSNITINPSLTSNALGSFNIETTGYIQGTALDSPNARYNLAGGQLVSTAAAPMWGGSAIYEKVASLTAYNSPTLGNTVGLATTALTAAATSICGWTVFDQDYAAINSPQSPVPLVSPGGSVHYYRLGSGARIAVQCDPELVSLQGGSTGILSNNANGGYPTLYWDPVNQFLAPIAGNITVNTLVYSSTTGLITVTLNSAWTTPVVGSVFSLSGVTSNTGTANYALLNAEQVITSVTSTTVFTFAAPTGLGTWSTIGLTSGLIATNLTITGIVKVLDVNIGNSMTVLYDAYTGFANWNRSGSTAIILI
jgi:hypothetical protein